MNRPQTFPEVFAWRLSPCPNEACDDGRETIVDRRGYTTTRCEECEGRGEVDASCADCLCIAPLNLDGFCEDCACLVEIETLGPGRIAV